MNYIRIDLENMTPTAFFDSLPSIYAGVDPTTLLDMNWGGENIGYWPTENNDQVFDPATETLDDAITYTPVKSRQVVKTRRIKRDLTDEELLARERAASPVQEIISDRQFAEQLALENVITDDEALKWVSIGELPLSLAQIVAAIPDPATQQAVLMRLKGATEFHRANPYVEMLGSAMSFTASQLDDIWRKAALLV